MPPHRLRLLFSKGEDLFVLSIRLRVSVQEHPTEEGFLWSFALSPVFVLNVWE